MDKLVIMGAGQQGRTCKRLAIENGYEVVSFIDDFKTGEVEGLPVYRDVLDIEGYRNYKYFVAVGKTEYRKKFVDTINRLGLLSVNLIDKDAVIEDGAVIGTGNYIYKFAIVYASASVGNHNIINCKAVLATDSKIGDNNNVSMGCNLCGGVEVGDNCYIGCQASIVSGCKVGDNAVIGAGSVVLGNVDTGEFVAGVPSVRKERRRK